MSLSDNLGSLWETVMYNWSLKLFFSMALTAFVWTVGKVDSLLLYLLALMLMDFAFGFFRAWKMECLSSAKLKYGAVKFGLYWLVVVTAVLADRILTACPVGDAIEFLKVFGITITIKFRGLIITYLCLTELLSILEHLSAIGAPIPKFLVRRLRAYKDIHFDSDDSTCNFWTKPLTPKQDRTGPGEGP